MSRLEIDRSTGYDTCFVLAAVNITCTCLDAWRQSGHVTKLMRTRSENGQESTDTAMENSYTVDLTCCKYIFFRKNQA